jgi:hypothetical protein
MNLFTKLSLIAATALTATLAFNQPAVATYETAPQECKAFEKDLNPFEIADLLSRGVAIAISNSSTKQIYDQCHQVLENGAPLDHKKWRGHEALSCATAKDRAATNQLICATIRMVRQDFGKHTSLEPCIAANAKYYKLDAQFIARCR